MKTSNTPAVGDLTADEIGELEAHLFWLGRYNNAKPDGEDLNGDDACMVHDALAGIGALVPRLLAAHRAQAAEIEELKAARNRAHLEGRRAILDETDALRQRAEDAELIVWGITIGDDSPVRIRRIGWRSPGERWALLCRGDFATYDLLSLGTAQVPALDDAARAALKAAKEARQ